MKTLITILILLFSLPVFSQSDREDVIYMKNGSIYHGTIIDQVYGMSYKIQTTGDSLVVVPAGDIEKITKENKVGADTAAHYYYSRLYNQERKIPRAYKDKGYFFEMQFHINVIGGGLRMINGYKFNQYAILGLGIGVGGVYIPANGFTANIDGDISPFMGFYFPFFLYYSGDILHKRTTPFYVLEAGYAMAYDPLPGGADGATYVQYNILHGGPMGSAGFGIRIYAGSRFVFTLSANLDFQYSRTDVYTDGMRNGGFYNNSNTYTHTTMLMPGLKIGLGLVR